MTKNNDEKKIVIPEEEGFPAVVITWENGQHTFQHLGWYDGVEYTSQMYVNMINRFLYDDEYQDKQFLALPSAQRPEEPTWYNREFLRNKVAHIHQAIVKSPLAQRKMGGQQIVVPLPGTRIQ